MITCAYAPADVIGIAINTLLNHSPYSGVEHNSELQVRALGWTGAASRAEEAGSLPVPVRTADVCCRIMGGITSPPAVLVHKASQTDKKQAYHRPGPFPAAQGATGPVQLQEIQLFQPAATELCQRARCRN